ncbi:MAG: hypothetical protein WC538_11145 [Thermoanaerobaculia bacterium]|jgi:hypothetical protein
MSLSIARAAMVATMLLCVVAVAADDTSYQIVLDRPTTVGATYGIVSTGHNVEHVIITNGKTVLENKTTETRVALEASATVLAVDENARPAKVKLKLTRLTIAKGNEQLDPFPPGTELIAEADGGAKRFSVGGVAVTENIGKALSLVHAVGSTDETNDDVLGTSEKKKVGDSWPVNAAFAAKSFHDSGIDASADAVTGETKLVSVSRIDGVDCLQLSSTLEMGSLEMQLPPGFKMKEGKLSVRYSAAFPIDTSLGKLEESLEGSTSMRAVQTGGGKGPWLEITATGERSTVAKFTYE